MKGASILIALAASSAAADPSDAPLPAPARHEIGFVGGGLGFGGDPQFVYAVLTLEGGAALPTKLPLVLHASLERGAPVDYEGIGAFWRATGGIELQACTETGGACWIGGLDAGYQRVTWSDSEFGETSETHHGFVAGPRIGIDVGGTHVRVRATLQGLEYHHASNIGNTSWERAGGFSLALAYRL